MKYLKGTKHQRKTTGRETEKHKDHHHNQTWWGKRCSGKCLKCLSSVEFGLVEWGEQKYLSDSLRIRASHSKVFMFVIFDDEFVRDLSYSIIPRTLTLTTTRHWNMRAAFLQKAPNIQKFITTLLLCWRKKPQGQSMKSISHNVVSQSNITNIWYI